MNKKNRVLILVPDLTKRGGVANYYNALKPELSSEMDYFYRGARDSRNCLLKIIDSLWNLFRFVFVLKKFDSVLVNTSFDKIGIVRDSLFILFIRLFNKGYVVFYRGWNVGFEQRVKNGLFWFIFKHTFIKARKSIVLSNNFKEFLQANSYRNPVIIESTIIDKALLNDFNIRNKIFNQLNSQIISLLFLARLEEVKGLYQCIEILDALNDRGLSAILTIAGTGSEEGRLHNLIKNRSDDSIRYLGYLSGEEKRKALEEASFYLFPSRHGEGMPNSVLEAMGFGIPVLTTYSGGIKDFFTEDMGMISQKFNIKDWSDYIEECFKDKERYKRISAYNHDFAISRFLSNVTYERLERIICN